MTAGEAVADRSRPGSRRPLRRHLEDVTAEIDAVLSWSTYQPRNADGTFGWAAIVPGSETT
eukprot:4391874-Alexandrium_andersonii.AAC.1